MMCDFQNYVPQNHLIDMLDKWAKFKFCFFFLFCFSFKLNQISCESEHFDSFYFTLLFFLYSRSGFFPLGKPILQFLFSEKFE